MFNLLIAFFSGMLVALLVSYFELKKIKINCSIAKFMAEIFTEQAEKERIKALNMHKATFLNTGELSEITDMLNTHNSGWREEDNMNNNDRIVKGYVDHAKKLGW